MLEKVTSLNNELYLITPSLLNSWTWIWECINSVKEADSDTISLEDKQSEVQEKAYNDFLKTLRREKIEPNEYMLAVIEFEKQCYEGKTCISPIIEGGAYQIVGKKKVQVCGLNFLMYGRLDVLKGGIIYDIKRVWKYTLPKYKWSTQHGFYLDLFDKANKFEYLIFDGNKLHIETYYREQYIPTVDVIENFINWLKDKDLLNIYLEYWKSKY